MNAAAAAESIKSGRNHSMIEVVRGIARLWREHAYNNYAAELAGEANEDITRYGAMLLIVLFCFPDFADIYRAAGRCDPQLIARVFAGRDLPRGVDQYFTVPR